MKTLKPISTWPYDQEIFYHLDYIPYIDLKVKFNPQVMMSEALALLDQFVEHRSYNQENKVSDGKWKSLGLRTFEGDPSKTEYHTSYTSAEKGNYQNTPLLEKCPETLKFLNSLTDIEQCDRIRFMLLEPGTEIKTHSDSARDVSFAINISLNMPSGCVFWSNLNQDGSHCDYSLKIPFSDNGSVFLFNNSKYHKLKNDSSSLRMHIIFHGPVKFTDDYILSSAREQNRIFTRKEIIKRLVHKKAFMGESFAKTPALLKDWVHSGLTEDGFGDSVSLAVIKTTDEALEKITRPSLFPLAINVIEESSLDAYLSSLAEKQFAVICAAGTFIKQTYQFLLESLKQMRRMREQGAVISGHIIAHPGEAPYLHQQFFIVDIVQWRNTGSAKFGTFFSEEKVIFPSFERGNDIHDDYTPEFLKSGSEYISIEGNAHLGSRVMAASLERGFPVLNLSNSLRETKDYTYPLDDNAIARERVENEIAARVFKAREEVYFFNNEELQIPQIKGFEPTLLVSVAAGFKAIKILDQYNYPSDAKVIFADFSANALNYVKAVTAHNEFDSILQQIEKFNKVLMPDNWSKGLNENRLKAMIRDYFNNDVAVFFKNVKIASKAKLKELNFVMQPEKLVELLEERPFVIWVSNAFYNNHVYHLIGVDDSEKRYHDLALMIAKKFKLHAFAEIGTRNILFGESLDRPMGFLTDGCSQTISDRAKDFIKLV